MNIKVHKLAKELGVDRKAIIEKCLAEGVTELDSHLSTVKAGLAESIREWFSKGAPQTAVEKTAHVAVEKVPQKRGRKKKNADDAEPSSATHTAVMDAPVAGTASPTDRTPSTEAPARRPRGRPRKVVPVAPVSVPSEGPRSAADP